MEHVGQALSGIVTVHDVIFTDVSWNCSCMKTPLSWCTLLFSFFFTSTYFSSFALWPPINRALLWPNIPLNRNYPTAGRNLTCRISVNPVWQSQFIYLGKFEFYLNRLKIGVSRQILAKIFYVNFGKIVFNGLDDDIETDGQT
jgi:hypothetical protein